MCSGFQVLQHTWNKLSAASSWQWDGDSVRTRVRERERGGGKTLILENCQFHDDIQGFGDYTQVGGSLFV